MRVFYLRRAQLTFDYQFERLGAKKQKCYCGEKTCRGSFAFPLRARTRTRTHKFTRTRYHRRMCVCIAGLLRALWANPFHKRMRGFSSPI